MFEVNKIKANIWKYYIASFLGGFAYFYNGIETIYYRHWQLSFQQIGILFSANMIASLIMDIPAGAFADIYGRKKSLILGAFFNLSGITLLAIGSNFWIFLAGFICWGIGSSFNVGASSAILYDSLRAINQENTYTKHSGRTWAAFLSVDIISNTLGPLMFSVNVRLPYYVAWISMLLVFVSYWSLYESPKLKDPYAKARRHFRLIKDSFRSAAGNKTFIWLSVFWSLFYFVATVKSEILGGPYLLDSGFTLKDMSLIGLIASLIQTINTFYADKIEKKLKEAKSFVLLVTMIPTVIVLFALSKNIILTAVLLGAFYSLMSYGGVIIESYLNKAAGDAHRATMLSINSMFNRGLTMVTIPVIGYFTDATSTRTSLYLIALIPLVLGGIMLSLYKEKPATNVALSVVPKTNLDN